MKSNVFFCGWLIMFCIISCTQNERLITADIIDFDYFAQEFNKSAYSTDISIMGVLDISIYENIMVAFTMNPVALISIIDIDTEETLYVGGVHGRGPEEFLSLSTDCQFVNRNGHICIWIHDRNARKSTLIDITETVEKQTIVSCESLQFGRMYEQMNGMLFLPTGEHFIKFPTIHKDARDDIHYYPKYVYFSDDTEVRELPFFKHGSFLLSASNNETVSEIMFNGVIHIKPDGTKAIDAFHYADHLNFLDLVKNQGFSMRNSKGMSVDELASASDTYLRQNFVYVYNGVAVTDEYVLALYSGKPEEWSGEIVPYTKSAIRIFDWNGSPLYLVHIDKELRSITYDRRTKRLYALDLDENIMYYELDDVI